MLTVKLMSPVSGMETARVGKYKLSVEACRMVTARLLAVAGFMTFPGASPAPRVRMFGAAVIVVVGVVGFLATTPGSDKSEAGDNNRRSTLRHNRSPA